jgi:hypothetical protein
MGTHRFNVGQTARLLQSLINRNKSIRCQILQIMPFDGTSFQYRVRGENERFDRIAQEHELAEMTPLEAETGQPDDPTGWETPPRRQDRP